MSSSRNLNLQRTWWQLVPQTADLLLWGALTRRKRKRPLASLTLITGLTLWLQGNPELIILPFLNFLIKRGWKSWIFLNLLSFLFSVSNSMCSPTGWDCWWLWQVHYEHRKRKHCPGSENYTWPRSGDLHGDPSLIYILCDVGEGNTSSPRISGCGILDQRWPKYIPPQVL